MAATKITRTEYSTFKHLQINRSTMKLSRVSIFFRICEKKKKKFVLFQVVVLVRVVILVLESKGLYLSTWILNCKK